MMTEGDISTTDEAFAYMADCNLATVELLASQKARSRMHFLRHINVAQTALRLAASFDIDLRGTRADEVCDKFDGSVEDWANSMIADS